MEKTVETKGGWLRGHSQYAEKSIALKMHETNYFVIVLVLLLVIGFHTLRFDYDHE